MGVDWGSVADWVGAVGGVGGAGTAATFYFLDRKRAGLALQAEEKKQAKFDTDVATHLYVLLRSIIEVSRSYLDHEITFADTTALRAELAAFATTATRMQSLSGLSIDRFMDLCDLLCSATIWVRSASIRMRTDCRGVTGMAGRVVAGKVYVAS